MISAIRWVDCDVESYLRAIGRVVSDVSAALYLIGREMLWCQREKIKKYREKWGVVTQRGYSRLFLTSAALGWIADVREWMGWEDFNSPSYTFYISFYISSYMMMQIFVMHFQRTFLFSLSFQQQDFEQELQQEMRPPQKRFITDQEALTQQLASLKKSVA